MGWYRPDRDRLIKGLIYFAKKDKNERSTPDLLVGVLQLAVGIFAVVKTEFLASHFPIVAASCWLTAQS